MNDLITGNKNVENLPAHMQEDAGEGMQEASDFIMPPVLRFVQKTSDSATLKKFGFGAAVLFPEGTVVSNEEASFEMIPLYWFPEWITMNPIGTKPVVLQSTLDGESDLARKCKDPNMRKELIDGKECTNVERLNFVFLIINHSEMDPVIVAHSFYRSEWRTGSSLLASISRKKSPIYGASWVFTPKLRSNDQGEWYGFDIEFKSFIEDAEMYAKLKETYLTLREKSIIVREENSDEPEKAPNF